MSGSHSINHRSRIASLSLIFVLILSAMPTGRVSSFDPDAFEDGQGMQAGQADYDVYTQWW